MHPRARLRLHLPVVRPAGDPLRAERLGDLVGLLRGRHVHDRAAAADQVGAHRVHGAAALLAHAERQVGPVDRRDELDAIAQLQAALDVLAGVERGGGVTAMTGHCGSSARSSLRVAYSGRKSWPHSDTQCASSTASRQGLQGGEGLPVPVRRGHLGVAYTTCMPPSLPQMVTSACALPR